ncbi:alpha/beta fold hydrolase [Agrobacterium sp. LAD9]|uniref:alpha/beta fold hydrolase n=1 Tax=Agrobacterium sp. LAD9 TaxID=2055153 RepID=UPI000D1EFE5E|nr:alpha/beta hydrolase [Agrobacterium sp. LAD9]
MKLYFEADAEQGQPPLLLVHGMLSSRNHWLPNKSLSERFRVVRIDLPAHGLSPPPRDVSGAAPEALVEAIEAVRDQLQIHRWHICGQSFGAALTLRYALTFPDRVIAQVFTNANGALREQWGPLQQDRNLSQITDILREGHAAMRRLPYHPCHAKRFPPALRETLSRDADATDVDGIALLMAEATPRLSVRDRLGELRVATLLINGRWEKQFQPVRIWLSQAHPHIVVRDLDGGHSINIECANGFDAAVTKFLLAHQ